MWCGFNEVSAKLKKYNIVCNILIYAKQYTDDTDEDQLCKVYLVRCLLIVVCMILNNNLKSSNDFFKTIFLEKINIYIKQLHRIINSLFQYFGFHLILVLKTNKSTCLYVIN